MALCSQGCCVRAILWGAEGGGGGGWYRFSSCVNACVLCVLSTAVQYRYTEWVRFNHTTAVADWTDVWGRELYDHTLPTDFFDDENANIVDQPAMKETVQQLHEMLREGWRSAMPTTSPLDIWIVRCQLPHTSMWPCTKKKLFSL